MLTQQSNTFPALGKQKEPFIILILILMGTWDFQHFKHPVKYTPCCIVYVYLTHRCWEACRFCDPYSSKNDIIRSVVMQNIGQIPPHLKPVPLLSEENVIVSANKGIGLFPRVI